MDSIAKNNLLKNIYDFVKKNYAIFIMLLYVFAVILFAIVKKDNVYLALNDNMDSNIPIYKMIRDNGLFWKYDESIPFLGGVLPRSQYKVELSLQSWIYMLMPTLVAYYTVYILKIVMSSIGFFALAINLEKYEKVKYCNKNIWGIIGLVYGMLGGWPHTALGFASLPWWMLLIYLIYMTHEKKYIFIILIMIFSTSFMMLGVFALFYTGLFWFFTCIRDKKLNINLFVATMLLAIGYIFTNFHHLYQGMNASSWTIKSLKCVTYTESIKYSLSKFKDAFLFKYPYFHTGGSVLRYFVIPLCTLFGLWFVIQAIRKKIDRAFVRRYLIIYVVIVINSLACCADNNYRFRQLIPFASGFGFSRFAWLSPFLWMILFSSVCVYIRTRGIRYICIIVAALSVILDPMFNTTNSMYNELHCNVMAMLGDESFKDGNHEWTWKEYYSENLFDKVEEEMGYDGSWAIAYGFEPAVLQYNGISTLDGYFSNYSLEYHDMFQRLIQPELDIDEHHAEYWNSSSGMRAYVWSPNWDFLLPKETDIEKSELYIDSEVFKEMGGRYVFSRVEITNSSDCNLKFIGMWDDQENSPYKVYVYEIAETPK